MQRLGCGRSTVYRLGKAGILPQAEPMEGCSSAGWLEDDVDALVESRRPAGNKPVTPAMTAPRKSSHAEISNGIEDAIATVPVCTPADSGATGVSKPVQDLVPTTLRIMGNVVYLHAPTGRLLMDIGNLSAPGRGTDLAAIAATRDEAIESADFRASAMRKQKGEKSGPHGRGNLRS
jgi:predicted DNA-binding transcriptional regulator AlpA